MAFSSHQINQMMAGQQSMFGNVASYAHQISPMGQSMGTPPTYAAPYAPTSSPGTMEYNQGAAAAPGMLNAAASFGAPMMMGAGMMMGGRVGGMLDPTTAAMRGFGSGVGWQGGAGLSANLGTVASRGIGGIAKGIGMGAVAAAPVMAAYSAGKYALGQMAEGAQFQNQVNHTLQNSFRFSNDQSRTGQGFGQGEQRQIGSMLQNMGTDSMMSTPQEMLKIMNQGVGMGQFRGVQDAKEFRKKFTEMKDSLTEIAKTFNTTLSEAVPFFQNARQQGFWTPQDITKHATQVRQTQASTGMSARQAQAVMGMGAQMSRSIGGTGQQGSEMMAKSQQMSGSALYGGVVSSRMLGEAGFGTGAEGAQNLGNMLAGASTRFARSRTGRWALASMMNKDGTGLDKGALQRLSSGSLSIKDISRNARKNVSGARAYQFVENEGELRGQLAEAGPQAAIGIAKSLVGGRLYGTDSKDKLVTRRIIQRFMGGNKRQADIVAKLAREMPRMLAIQAAKSEGAMDTQQTQRDRMMDDTYEGFKRGLGHWWEKNIDNPLKEAGSDFSYRVGRTWQKFSDKLFGTAGRGVGLSTEGVRSMVRSATTGNSSYVTNTMGDSGMMGRELGGGIMNSNKQSLGGSAQMLRMGFKSKGMDIGLDGIGHTFSNKDVASMQSLVGASRGMAGESEALSVGYGGSDEMRAAMKGEGAKQIQNYLKTGEVQRLRGGMGGGQLDVEDREEYAGKVLTRIRAGRAGEKAMQMFSGLGKKQALGRLMAMQGSARKGRTSLGDMGGEALQTGKGMMEAIEDYQADATSDLATSLRGGEGDSWGGGSGFAGKFGGIKGVAVTEQSIDELKRDPRGEKAMRLFARARSEKDPEKAAILLKEARGIMDTIGNDPDVSKEAASAAIRLADGSDPQAKVIADMAGKVGVGLMVGDRAAFKKKIAMRRSRLKENMGEGGMAKLDKLAGGDEAGLGQAFREVMSGGTTVDNYASRMEGLARAAAADPEKAGAMLSVMKASGQDATDIGVVLESALNVNREAQDMGLKSDIGEDGKIGKKARRGINKRLGQLGISGTSSSDIDKLIRGGDVSGVRDSLKSQGYEEAEVSKFLGEMRGGMTVAEMKEGGVRGAAARGITTLSDKVAKRAGLDDTELAGKLTGRTGSGAIVSELETHTQQNYKLIEAIGSLSRKEKIPKKDKKKP